MLRGAFFRRAQAEDRLLVVNFGVDLHFDPAPQPLLAPPDESPLGDSLVERRSDVTAARARPPLDTDENWRMPGEAAVLLKAVVQVMSSSQAATGRPTRSSDGPIASHRSRAACASQVRRSGNARAQPHALVDASPAKTRSCCSSANGSSPTAWAATRPARWPGPARAATTDC